MSGRDRRATASSPHGQLPASPVSADNPQGRPLCPNAAVTSSLGGALGCEVGLGRGRGRGERRDGWRERAGLEVGVGVGRERAQLYHPTEWAQALAFISPSAPAGGGGGGGTFFPVSFRRGTKSLRVMSRARRVRSFVRPLGRCSRPGWCSRDHLCAAGMRSIRFRFSPSKATFTSLYIDVRLKKILRITFLREPPLSAKAGESRARVKALPLSTCVPYGNSPVTCAVTAVKRLPTH